MRQQFSDIVVVTGGAGFIGSNYLNKYVPLRPERLFINIDTLTYAGDLANVEVGKAKNYLFEKADIRDIGKLRRLFKKHRPTAIINFAAESHVDLSIKNPSVFIETNIIGTHNLLQLAREHGIQRFHQISTDEVYGAHPGRKGAFKEDSLLAPRSPYSASKAGADKMVRAYRETYGLDTVITRSCNVYGPRQDASKVIPRFMTQLLKDEKVPLYSKGEHIREWIYVEDCIDAIHRAFERGRSGEIYNIGTGHELTNLDLTKTLLSLAGKDESYIDRVADRPGHDFRYAVDTSKIEKELKWKPKVPFSKGIKKTFEHYRQKISS